MNTPSLVGACLLGLAAFPAIAAEVDTRGGSCDDAKKQHEYYCEGKNDPNDIFTQANIACNNAKRNMAAACEGKVAPDAEYKFEKK
ncbi:MAG: hypothetical protein ABI619_09920 [Betaproteobacteria bacterium]